MSGRKPEGVSRTKWKQQVLFECDAEIDRLNALRAVETFELDARSELSLDLYSRLDPSLWPMAERLYARFGDGLVYVGPQR